jgi:glutathione S-transferase
LAVKLHRCPNLWLKLAAHPCWRVQSALDEAGVEYVIVKGPLLHGRRAELERLSGQRAYPVIEFEDGSVYRDESAAMAERIRAGTLLEGARGAAPAGETGSGGA